MLRNASTADRRARGLEPPTTAPTSFTKYARSKLKKDFGISLKTPTATEARREDKSTYLNVYANKMGMKKLLSQTPPPPGLPPAPYGFVYSSQFSYTDEIDASPDGTTTGMSKTLSDKANNREKTHKGKHVTLAPTYRADGQLTMLMLIFGAAASTAINLEAGVPRILDRTIMAFNAKGSMKEGSSPLKKGTAEHWAETLADRMQVGLPPGTKQILQLDRAPTHMIDATKAAFYARNIDMAAMSSYTTHLDAPSDSGQTNGVIKKTLQRYYSQDEDFAKRPQQYPELFESACLQVD